MHPKSMSVASIARSWRPSVICTCAVCGRRRTRAQTSVGPCGSGSGGACLVFSFFLSFFLSCFLLVLRSSGAMCCLWAGKVNVKLRQLGTPPGLGAKQRRKLRIPRPDFSLLATLGDSSVPHLGQTYANLESPFQFEYPLNCGLLSMPSTIFRISPLNRPHLFAALNKALNLSAGRQCIPKFSLLFLPCEQ
ncbi:hypothetical protein C8R47DRAFT_47712 [Mycena vitilis]|nr:hypothetical protein C8R47DRAFT_47712 [Mycena vitilis]